MEEPTDLSSDRLKNTGVDKIPFILRFNLLKPSGFFTNHLKILHGARFALSVLYEYQNRQRFFLYRILPD